MYQIRIIGHLCAVAALSIIRDSILVTAKKMSLTFTVPDSAPVALYPFGPRNMYPLLYDSAQIMVYYTEWNGGQYVLGKRFCIADRNGRVPTGIRTNRALYSVLARQGTAMTLLPWSKACPEAVCADPLGRIVRWENVRQSSCAGVPRIVLPINRHNINKR